MHSLTPELSAQMERIAEIYGQSYLVRNKDGSMQVLSPQDVLVVTFHGKSPVKPQPPSYHVGVLSDALDTLLPPNPTQ
ncbi:hypothetical protein [Salmonella phage PMBT28]|nr:hypothetical protein [Salmonella phage PMBT28]